VQKGSIIEVGGEFSDLTGYPAADIAGKKLNELISLLKLYSNSIPGIENTVTDCIFFTKCFDVVEATVSVYREDSGDKVLYAFNKKTYSTSSSRFQYMEYMFSTNVSGFAVFTIPGQVLLKANQRFLDYFKRSSGQERSILGLSIKELYANWDDSELKQICNDAIEKQKPVHAPELKISEHLTDAAYQDIIISPVVEGSLVKFLLVNAQDVTERVLRNNFIEEQTKMIMRQNEILENSIKTKNEFLSIISHELRTPITVINAAVQALENLYKDDLTEIVKGYVSKIKQNNLRQLRLVNNFLSMLKLESGALYMQKRNVDIVRVTRAITKSVSVYAWQKGIDLYFTSSVKKKVIALDDEKYEKILLNLLSNAIKFTPCGKSIYVSIRNTKDKICLEVKDEGCGIPKNKQKIIFECFGQVDNSLTRIAEGTGIGLYLTKLLVKALDGEIDVISQEDIGSTFTVTLPSSRISETDAEPRPQRVIRTNNLTHSAAVEFSDIYFD
jgi:signal transduction histidine kinase